MESDNCLSSLLDELGFCESEEEIRKKKSSVEFLERLSLRWMLDMAVHTIDLVISRLSSPYVPAHIDFEQPLEDLYQVPEQLALMCTDSPPILPGSSWWFMFADE
ncbi:hypothetical protein AHF37_11698 [Paragonimus kellicotti]|nr:hypothetical protein AHF37_11698 [Paragonimus kellicotti]